MGPNPEGFYNRDLWLLDVVAGDARSIIFSYGCHPVLVYGYAYDSISADWPGVCRNRLQEALGRDVQAQFVQGLAGNVRPREVADLDQGIFRKPTMAQDHMAAGAQLADDVLSALGTGGEALDLELAAVAGFALAPRDLDKAPQLTKRPGKTRGAPGPKTGGPFSVDLESGQLFTSVSRQRTC